MKICVIAPTVIPLLGKDQRYGGIELVVSLAVEELVARGHEVFLFASGDSHTSAELVPVTPRALGQGNSLKDEGALNRKAYELALEQRPDVIWDHTLAVHAHVLREDTSLVEEEFNWKMDIVLDPDQLVDTGEIPVIQTLHGPAKDHLPGLAKALSTAGNYLVSISHDQARRFAPYINTGHYLGTVYNAVDVSLYSVAEHKRADYLVWLGRYGMEKGAHIALAVAHLAGMPIKIVGKKVEVHEQKYFNQFIQPNLRADDEVLTDISLEEKAKLYRDARATLMTNLWPEPFGLVAIESMASGTPVVGPALGALIEIIDGSGVLVPVEDLNIHEHEASLTPAQQRYIDRVAAYLPRVDEIPAHLPRDRVMKFFTVKHNVDGYEEAFAKALYLSGKKTRGLGESA